MNYIEVIKMNINELYLGDNLEILKLIKSDSIDLIYLDPPFFSNRNYEVIWGDEGEIRSFKDRWSGGIDHYTGWLKERVIEMHRVLKPTGSIFLHCDWHANAYIRVDILDKIFGIKNFRNEIVWQRHNAHNDARNKLSVLKDNIFYYTKTKKYTFHPTFTKLSDGYKDDAFKNEDKRGKYSSRDLTGPNINQNDVAWKGFHPKDRGRSWSVPKETVFALAGDKAKKLTTIEKLELLEENNYIIWTVNGVPRFKHYLETSKGIVTGDVWTDIQNVQAASGERIGYPTQKPEALLERIINMASNKGDIILDPFVGGGTTIAVADKLNRKWIGIDQSPIAVKVSDFRLQKQTDLFTAPYTVQLYKYDYDTLRYKEAFEFESWIIRQYGGTPNTKQRGDSGIDGKTETNIPIQVKRSDDIGRNVIDNFLSAVQRYDKNIFAKNKKAKTPVGYIIAFSFSKGAIEEAARLKKDDIIIKLLKVEDIVPVAAKPVLNIKAKELERDERGSRKIEFTAKAESESGIEFYSWDFDYDAEKGFKPSVIIDKEGKQLQTLGTGTHSIAVKVVDNDGLENTEVFQLKINGMLKKIK